MWIVLAFLSWKAWIWEWICSRWRRIILYMVAWHIMEMLKHTNRDELREANRTRSSQNTELATNTETIQIATRIWVTLEDLTMLGYCSGLWMAMSLSMLITVITANELPHRNDPIVQYILENINFRLTDRENNSTKLLAMNIGCAMKPTLKSVVARPQSSRMDGERRNGVFHTPYKTNAFPKARAKFTIQLAMMMTRWTAVSVIFWCVISIYQPRYRLWCAIFTSFHAATDFFSSEHAADLSFRPTADLKMFSSTHLVRFTRNQR